MKKTTRKIRKKAKANKKKILKSGVVRKQAHASSRNKRSQARRDGKK